MFWEGTMIFIQRSSSGGSACWSKSASVLDRSCSVQAATLFLFAPSPSVFSSPPFSWPSLLPRWTEKMALFFYSLALPGHSLCAGSHFWELQERLHRIASSCAHLTPFSERRHPNALLWPWSLPFHQGYLFLPHIPGPPPLHSSTLPPAPRCHSPTKQSSFSVSFQPPAVGGVQTWVSHRPECSSLCTPHTRSPHSLCQWAWVMEAAQTGKKWTAEASPGWEDTLELKNIADQQLHQMQEWGLEEPPVVWEDSLESVGGKTVHQVLLWDVEELPTVWEDPLEEESMAGTLPLVQDLAFEDAWVVWSLAAGAWSEQLVEKGLQRLLETLEILSLSIGVKKEDLTGGLIRVCWGLTSTRSGVGSVVFCSFSFPLVLTRWSSSRGSWSPSSVSPSAASWCC